MEMRQKRSGKGVNRMAKCGYCEKEMRDAETTTCTGNTIQIDGKDYDPIPYEAHYGTRCHDCNVSDEGIHHPGCDVEECPKCHGQLISCGCLPDDEEEEEEEEK